MWTALTILVFLIGLAVPLFLVRKAFYYHRGLRAAVKVVERQSRQASPTAISEMRATLSTAEERARWDQLMRSVRQRTGGPIQVGHILWAMQVLQGNRPPEPVPGLDETPIELNL